MFRQALAIANAFTFPVVISRKTVGGQCASGIATFVVINEEGWIVTAGHVLRMWKKLTTSVEQTRAAQAAQKAINADPNLNKKEKAQRIAAGPVVGKDDNDRCSAWWADDASQLNNFGYFDLFHEEFGEVVDIGVGQLVPFDPKRVTTYPKFKNPKKDFEPGTSLCKLGFPFHAITPSWDDVNERFVLPKGAIPLPRFPIEGIFTRTAEVEVTGDAEIPFPFRYLETSSPGLKGQSGGPTVDTQGTIWAIQAKTRSLDLGFEGVESRQYLNVGLGIHPDTMFGLFDQQKIKYQVSDY